MTPVVPKPPELLLEVLPLLEPLEVPPELLELLELPELELVEPELPALPEPPELPELPELLAPPELLEPPELPELPELLEVPDLGGPLELPEPPKFPELVELVEPPESKELSEPFAPGPPPSSPVLQSGGAYVDWPQEMARVSGPAHNPMAFPRAPMGPCLQFRRRNKVTSAPKGRQRTFAETS